MCKYGILFTFYMLEYNLQLNIGVHGSPRVFGVLNRGINTNVNRNKYNEY